MPAPNLAVLPVVALLCGITPHLVNARAGAFATSRPRPPRSSTADADGVLAAVNAQRVQRGLRPLTLDQRLTQAALHHARDIARRGRLDHRGSDGSTVRQRVERAGYHWSTVAENLALTPSSSSRAVVDMWMHSRGHRENILNRHCTQMGLAHVRDMWVLVLARPR